MLAEKPDLQFVGAQNFADDEIVGSIVAQFHGTAGEFAGIANDNLVGIEQTRKLYRHFFPAARWTLNLRGFRHVRRHGKAHSAEQLNPFRDSVHKLHLLVKMFVKQKMKLVEGRSSHLPMRFLVQIAEGHRVREQKRMEDTS